MHKLQEEIIAHTGVKKVIDPKQEVEDRVNFLCDYLKASRAKGYVLGISGGVDSTCAGRLAQLAVEKIRSQGIKVKFVAMRLPYKIQLDEDDAQAAIAFIAPDEIITFNIGQAVDAFETEYARTNNTPLSDFTKGNTKARLRMVAQYAVGGDNGILVIGTDQAAENITGFFTKYGDGGADVLPLAGINKRQVRSLVEYLGAPESVWQKAPTADLLDNQPGRLDEDELGITYEQIDTYLEGEEISMEAAEKLEALFLRTRHKRHLPVTPTETWWTE